MQKLKYSLNKIKNYLLNLVYPNNLKCIFCGRELDENSLCGSCSRCLNVLPFITSGCACCGVQLKDNEYYCQTCQARKYYFESIYSVFNYTGMIKEKIHDLKIDNAKFLVPHFALFLAQLYATKNIKVDYVTFVPASKERIKERGYNQSQLLAKEFCKITNLKLLDLATKCKNTPHQTNTSFKDRQQNIKGSFAFNKKYVDLIKNKFILVVDDVVTTCATANEISKLILANGACACNVLSIARTNTNL